MEYYPPPPDPEGGQYQQYQYSEGFPAQHFHPSPTVAFDPAGEEHEHYANFDDGPNNFDVDSPPVPMESREQDDLRLAGTRGFRPVRRMKVDTVYKKAPGAPKRFRSSYVHFFTQFVEEKKQQVGPDGLPVKLEISSVSKESSQAWKSLPAEQRKYWDYVSEQEKQEYLKQKEAYRGPWRIATKKTKKKKDGAPKRSPSAFFLFVNAKRPVIKSKNLDMPNREVVKTCSEMWKTIPESEKAPFLEEEKKLRAQYHVEADNWKRQQQLQKQEEKDEREKKAAAKEGDRAMSPETFPPVLAPPPARYGVYANPPRYAATAKAGPSCSKKRKRDPNAPKRSPPAFFLFVNHCRPELKMQYPELRHTELVKLLGQKWTQMSEEEKRPFRDHEEQLRQQYHIDIKHYKKGAVPEQDYTNLGSLHVPIMKPQHVANTTAPIPPEGMHAPHHELDYHQPVPQNQPHYQQPMKADGELF